MPTIRSLLDQYGAPPPEIALDWAWQFRQRQSASPKPQGLLQSQLWTDVEVDADGRLECDQLSDEGIRAALEDLKPWAVLPELANNLTGSAALESTQPQLLTLDPAAPVSALSSSRLVRRPKARLRLQWLQSPKRFGPVIGAVLLLGCGIAFLWTGSKTGTSRLAEEPRDAVSASSAAPTELDPDAIAPQLDWNQLDRPTLDPTPSLTLSGTTPATPGETSAATLPVANLPVDSALVSENSTLPTSSVATVVEPDRPASASVEAASEPASVGAMNEIQAARKEAEKAERVIPIAADSDDDPKSPPKLDLPLRVAKPWMLTRETMRYRVTVPTRWNLNDRTAQWSLALEPVAGLTLEPQRPVTLTRQGLAVWKLYDADSKSPRAFLTVRALHHPRDHKLEIVFCGGAEDFPGLAIPLAQRWLAPLTLRVQSQAFELRGALAGLSTAVITPEQVTGVMQRKQAMTLQMMQSARLGAVLPEVNRLVDLVDGQVNLHVALKSETSEPPIATWGRADWE